MAITSIIDNLLEAGIEAAKRIWPDPIKQAEEIRKLEEMHQKGELAQLEAQTKLLLKQAEITLQDAKSSSRFQANWRPAIGWVAAISIGLMYIPKALVMTYIWTYQAVVLLNAWDGVSQLLIPAFPDLGVSDIIGLVVSMMGIAGLRTYEKKKSINTK